MENKHFPGETETEKVGHRTPSQAKTHFAHFNGFGKVKWRPTCTHAEAHSQVTCADFSPVLECFAEVKKNKICITSLYNVFLDLPRCSLFSDSYLLVWACPGQNLWSYTCLLCWHQISHSVPRCKQLFIVLGYTHMGNITAKSQGAFFD